jgi:hypothetical protein
MSNAIDFTENISIWKWIIIHECSGGSRNFENRGSTKEQKRKEIEVF